MFFGVTLSDTINVYQFDPICTNVLHLITYTIIYYYNNTYLIFPYGTWTSYICGDANGRPCHCWRANGNFRAKQGTVWVAQPKEMGYLQWFCVNLFLFRYSYVCIWTYWLNQYDEFVAYDGSGSPWGGYTVAWGICPALWQRWPEATIV